jgi:D-beta-D-heptose 7-phosphate kinase/D-beta-D-heptose 1-phosphate adenosyltransferase
MEYMMKIGLIGDHIEDIYIYGKMNRFSPESPIPIFDIEREEIRAGGASNVNNNLIKLGAYVYYFCDGVDYSVKRRYVCDNHIMFRCDEDKVSKVDCSESVFLEDCKFIILSDYNKGVLRQCQQLIYDLKSQGKTVIVDPKKSLVAYEGADIVKLNEDEYNRFSMVDGGYQETRKFYNLGSLVITRGRKGPIIVNDDGITELRGIDKEVSDVTGAGDIFIAAMTYYLASGKNIYNACDLANQLASLSVGHFGTYVLTEEDIRSVEKKTVFTNGCFDVLHCGHIHYLKESKKLGTRLVIGLNSDQSVKRLKGDSRPIHNQEDRKKVLEALDCVDEVIIFDEDTPYELIKQIQPDIITKGGDYKTKDDVVGNDLAEVVLIPFLEGYSTTKTLEILNADC